jgi:hypothetical protein
MEGGVMQRIIHYKADDLIINLNVGFQDDAPITTLTGSTVEAIAKGPSTVNADSIIIQPSGTELKIVFNDGSLAVGQWQMQVRVTLDDITQTIAEAIIDVKTSF